MSKYIIAEMKLGIISGEQKRIIEPYLDARLFRQRKTYDEYYVDIDVIEGNFSIRDLMILAEGFDIEVKSNRIVISET